MIERFKEERNEQIKIGDLERRVRRIETWILQWQDMEEHQVGVDQFSRAENITPSSKPSDLSKWRENVNLDLPSSVYINHENRLVAKSTQQVIGEVKWVDNEPCIGISVKHTKKQRCLTALVQHVKDSHYPFLFY